MNMNKGLRARRITWQARWATYAGCLLLYLGFCFMEPTVGCFGIGALVFAFVYDDNFRKLFDFGRNRSNIKRYALDVYGEDCDFDFEELEGDYGTC